MLTSEFNYHLPPELIAQMPLENRDHSRLMVVEKSSGKIIHSSFKKITDYLLETDILIFNNTKVMRSRLHAKRQTGGKVELFVTTPHYQQENKNTWLALLNPAKRIRNNDILQINETLSCKVLEKNY